MDGNMRRLPPWMIAGASSGVTATSNRTDEGEVKQEAEAPKTKKKRKTRRERDDSEEPKKVEIRRRGRYVKGEEEDQALSTSESMVVDVNDESNMKAPTSDDMISLLLGPFFNTRK
ncbi:hypothetical protein HID58_095648 [Brassica napus]|uniref:Uncharacterized protein n=1 Tax=Brassica napus TaxID=3708 RepID=A0ABQ7X2Y9_BRANA|nr:hypothetical protein HID58_095648 [Brassica napus]